jgi:LacI family transcriptional regulator
MALGRNSRRVPHVALTIETSKVYGRELLLGISKYVRLHGPWSIYLSERGQNDPDPAWLATWKGDGIITRSLDMRQCRLARSRGVAVVSLRHLLARPEFPTLFPDQNLIATRIAEHFFERGFRNFAYVGVPGNKGWELLRRESFIAAVHRRGFSNITIRTVPAEDGLDWEEREEAIAGWLQSLPRPVGIMVSHDTQGVELLDACRRAGVRVPNDVAVVSVDNDQVLCELAATPLSSLDQNVQKLGFEAAAMLGRMMAGKAVPRANHFIEPGQVVTRQSSDVIAVDDPRLVKAIQFIRENACKPVGIDDVSGAAGMSRRSLEKNFAKVIGRSPLEEVQEIRFRRVQQLLLETDYILPRVAEAAGFEYTEYLVRFFKKRSGVTPGQYRRKMRFTAAVDAKV